MGVGLMSIKSSPKWIDFSRSLQDENESARYTIHVECHNRKKKTETETKQNPSIWYLPIGGWSQETLFPSSFQNCTDITGLSDFPQKVSLDNLLSIFPIPSYHSWYWLLLETSVLFVHSISIWHMCAVGVCVTKAISPILPSISLQHY